MTAMIAAPATTAARTAPAAARISPAANRPQNLEQNPVQRPALAAASSPQLPAANAARTTAAGQNPAGFATALAAQTPAPAQGTMIAAKPITPAAVPALAAPAAMAGNILPPAALVPAAPASPGAPARAGAPAPARDKVAKVATTADSDSPDGAGAIQTMPDAVFAAIPVLPAPANAPTAAPPPANAAGPAAAPQAQALPESGPTDPALADAGMAPAGQTPVQGKAQRALPPMTALANRGAARPAGTAPNGVTTAAAPAQTVTQHATRPAIPAQSPPGDRSDSHPGSRADNGPARPVAATGLAMMLTPVASPASGAEAQAAPATAPAQGPTDFATLVESIARARAEAGAADTGSPVGVTMQHADFGRVSVQFTPRADGLGATLHSADPGFAPAAAAAASAATGSTAATGTGNQGDAPRHSGAQTAPDTAAQGSFAQDRSGTGSNTAGHPARTGGRAGPRAVQADSSADDNGIFA
eukprot:gene1741-1769_t